MIYVIDFSEFQITDEVRQVAGGNTRRGNGNKVICDKNYKVTLNFKQRIKR